MEYCVDCWLAHLDGTPLGSYCPNKCRGSLYYGSDSDAECSEDDQTAECSDDDHTAECSDDDHTAECSDDDHTAECSDDDHTAECSDDDHTTECSEKDSDTECSEDDGDIDYNLKDEEQADDRREQQEDDAFLAIPTETNGDTDLSGGEDIDEFLIANAEENDNRPLKRKRNPAQEYSDDISSSSEDEVHSDNEMKIETKKVKQEKYNDEDVMITYECITIPPDSTEGLTDIPDNITRTLVEWPPVMLEKFKNVKMPKKPKEFRDNLNRLRNNASKRQAETDEDYLYNKYMKNVPLAKTPAARLRKYMDNNPNDEQEVLKSDILYNEYLCNVPFPRRISFPFQTYANMLLDLTGK